MTRECSDSNAKEETSTVSKALRVVINFLTKDSDIVPLGYLLVPRHQPGVDVGLLAQGPLQVDHDGLVEVDGGVAGKR